MSISVTAENVNEDNQMGEDRSILPDLAALITVIADDTESEPMNIKGLHAVGLLLPTTALAGLTGVELHVANKEDGTYAKLVEGGEFTLTAALQAVGSPFILEWNWLKIVYVGTVTGSGEIPLSFA